MKYSIELTPQAKADMKEIFRYIAFDLQSVQNAEGQLNRIEKAIESLAQMPERFQVYGKKKWRERNLRIMQIDNYLVCYIPTSKDCKVTVLRVMYGRMDIDRQLTKR